MNDVLCQNLASEEVRNAASKAAGWVQPSALPNEVHANDPMRCLMQKKKKGKSQIKKSDG